MYSRTDILKAIFVLRKDYPNGIPLNIFSTSIGLSLPENSMSENQAAALQNQVQSKDHISNIRDNSTELNHRKNNV